MEGIEVLSIGSIGINQVFNWEAAIVGGLVLGFLCSLYAFFSTDSPLVGITIFISLGLFLGFILGVSVEKYADTVPTYKVTINDTISINEFYERYEVLEQDGKIFTIKEKTENGNNSLPAS